MTSGLVTDLEALFRGIARLSARLGSFLRQRQRIMQFTAAAIAVALGLWGWTIKEPPAGFSNWLDNIFRTAQLVTLQFPSELDTSIPWQLQVARLLVPLVAFVATIHVLVGAITRPIRGAFMPYVRGHIVLSGAARLKEEALNTLAARGQRIVTIVPVFDPAQCEALDALGITFVEADPFQSSTFRQVNLAAASALFLTHGDDIDNLDLAMLAFAAVEKRSGDLPPLLLGVMIDREDLARELGAALDGLLRKNNIRYYRLCPDREELRLEMRRFAPVFLKADPGEQARVLVVGLHGNWQQTIMQLIISSQDHPEALPLIVLVLDEQEAAAFATWRATKPDLDLVGRFEIIPRGEGLLPTAELLTDHGLLKKTPQLIVVLRADEDAVATALALRRPGNPFGLSGQPILVHRSKEDRLLARLGETEVRDRSLQSLIAFGGLVRPEAIERVLDRRGDEIAIALHQYYLGKVDTFGAGSKAALAAWDDLPENLREANRTAAEHAPILFAAVGLRIVPQLDRPGHELATEEIEMLARVEHRRWMAERIDRGWRSGSEHNDDLLIHPSIVPFELLTGQDQEKDRNAVRALHAALEHAGRHLVG
jgi:RyR domain